MIIKDIKREFFHALKGRVLILCALDVDAICACRILQSLLESYNLQYSVAPVVSIDCLLNSFEGYRNNVDSVVMINFGNLINVPQVLKPAENLNFYVIDSHRPIHVFNFYKNKQVKIFVNRDERDLDIPPESKIFLKTNRPTADGEGDTPSDPEQEEEEIVALLEADARELSNEQLEKRRKLRKWLLEKQKLVFDYEEYHFYNRSVSMIMYDLAYYLSKNNNYLLWLGIVGLTYQYRSDKIDASFFEKEAELTLRHISRNSVSAVYGNRWTISWEQDIQLELYRTWTIYESLRYTPMTVCRFRLWNEGGFKNLLGFLGSHLGLATNQATKPFKTMQRDSKARLLEDFHRVCLGDTQYLFNLQDLVTRTFTMKCGFEYKLCANDFALSIRALLESHDPKLSITEKFVRALKSLSPKFQEFDLLQEGFRLAQMQFEAMFNQIKMLITTQKVVEEGLFLYVDLREHDHSSSHFARGESLMAFTRFLLEAYVSSKPPKQARKAARLPMVLSCPDSYDEEQIILVGVTPTNQEVKRNFFSKAFETAAVNIGCEIKADLSETNLVRTNQDNKLRFISQFRELLG